MARWRQILKHKLFTRYLLYTNIAVSGGIEALGDFIEQKLEGHEHILWDRNARMCIIGLVLAGPYHFWYRFIDSRYPERTLRVVTKKVILDTFLMGPPHIAVFYLGMCTMEGKTWSESIKELKEKFLFTFLLECIFWPAAQMINFYYFPPTLRVIYVCLAELGWATVCSKLKHMDFAGLPHKNNAVESDSTKSKTRHRDT